MAKQQYLTLVEVCEYTTLPKEILLELIEHGLFENALSNPNEIQFDLMMINRIETACRLHHDLEVNASGIVLALELLDKLTALQEELYILRRHIE